MKLYSSSVVDTRCSSYSRMDYIQIYNASLVHELVDEGHFSHRTSGIPIYGHKIRVRSSSTVTCTDGVVYLVTWR